MGCSSRASEQRAAVNCTGLGGGGYSGSSLEMRACAVGVGWGGAGRGLVSHRGVFAAS